PRARAARRRHAASMKLQLARASAAADAIGLDAQQRGLAVEAAGIAGQRARAADDAMAGHDDRDRISAHRRADGATRRRQAELARDLAIAPRRAGLDAQERLPDVALECRALEVERHVEGIDLTVEVGAKLA